MNGIRLLTFDLDDTLWSIGPVIERAERRLHQWLLQHCPEAGHRYTPVALRALRQETERRYPELSGDLSELRRRSIRIALERCNGPVERTEEAFEVFWQARNEVEFHPDALPSLQRLGKHYTLAAVSNGNACIRLTGLDSLFDFGLNAIDAGAAKPAPDIFHLACETADVQPHETLHVGDDLECDVAGATNAGLHAAWLNRNNVIPESPLPPSVLRLRDLHALADHLLPRAGIMTS